MSHGTTWSGTGRLARLAVRRDRVLVAVWVLLLVGVCYASAAATASLYPSAGDRVAAAEGLDASPAIVALYGPVLDVHSLGELAMTKLTVLYAVFVAMLLVVVVRRHTRGAEESGRAELLGGTAVGRDAPLVAAVVEGIGISLTVGLLAAGADVAGGLPVAGSLGFGASWAGTGLVATGLTALACQLSASARTCAALTALALGVLFLLRAVGDVSVGWLGWLSPFGWSTRLRAWSDPRWWVLLLYAGTAVLLVTSAHLLRARRDLGSGLLAARPGPASGSARLSDAVALALRVHDPALATWTAAMAVLGLVLGAIAPGIGDLLDTPAAREMMQRLGGVGALQDTLLAAELSIAALVVTCFAIAVVGHGGPTSTRDAPSRCWRPPRHGSAPTSRPSSSRCSARPGCSSSPGRRSPWATAVRPVTSVPASDAFSPPPWRRHRPCGWSPRSRWRRTPGAAGGRSPAGASWPPSSPSASSASSSGCRGGRSTSRRTSTCRGCPWSPSRRRRPP